MTGQVNGGGNVSLLHQRKYTVPEAAGLIGVSETNLRAIIRAGRLPVLKVTKAKVLILEKDLEAFLQGRHVTIKEKDIRPPSKTPPPPDFVVNSEHLKRKVS